MVVADASAIIEVVLGSSLAARCTERLLNAVEVVCAPLLLDVEVAQVLRRYAARSEITPERGREALDDFGDLPITRYPHVSLVPRVWELRDSLSAYDALYVALAEALEVPLVTCDGRIAKAHGHGARVEVIA